jgi:hypothetical protein
MPAAGTHRSVQAAGVDSAARGLARLRRATPLVLRLPPRLLLPPGLLLPPRLLTPGLLLAPGLLLPPGLLPPLLRPPQLRLLLSSPRLLPSPGLLLPSPRLLLPPPLLGLPPRLLHPALVGGRTARPGEAEAGRHSQVSKRSHHYYTPEIGTRKEREQRCRQHKLPVLTPHSGADPRAEPVSAPLVNLLPGWIALSGRWRTPTCQFSWRTCLLSGMRPITAYCSSCACQSRRRRRGVTTWGRLFRLP